MTRWKHDEEAYRRYLAESFENEEAYRRYLMEQAERSIAKWRREEQLSKRILFESMKDIAKTLPRRNHEQ